MRELQPVVDVTVTAHRFPLSWTHYIRLMSVTDPAARALYEAEAIRSGWSVRQLDRQISTQFFERVSASAEPERMLEKARTTRPVDPEELQHHIRDPYLLEFLNLKDEYSETDLEDAIVRHLDAFLLELGAGFTFVARQKRLRIGDEWYRIDLLLYHRALRCLVVVPDPEALRRLCAPAHARPPLARCCAGATVRPVTCLRPMHVAVSG